MGRRRSFVSTCSTSDPSSCEDSQTIHSVPKTTAFPKCSRTSSANHFQKIQYFCDEQKTDKYDDFRLMTLSTFIDTLRANKLPLPQYKVGKAKSCKDLWIEVALGTSELKKYNFPSISLPPTVSPTLYRKVRTVSLELCTKINGADRFLLLKDHVREAGAARYGLYVPLEVHMFADEKPSDALVRLVVHSLKISEKHFNQHFIVEESTTSRKWQESLSFPGLLTSYKIKKCKVKLRNPRHSDVMCLGLPEGNEFTTTTESPFEHKCDSFFTWVSREEFQKHSLHEQPTSVHIGPLSDADELSDADDFCENSMYKISTSASGASKMHECTPYQANAIEAKGIARANIICGFVLLFVLVAWRGQP